LVGSVGVSTIHGQLAIVLIRVELFFTTVIFIAPSVSVKDGSRVPDGCYVRGSPGVSTIQGHDAMGLILGVLFLITVIFIAQLLAAHAGQNVNVLAAGTGWPALVLRRRSGRP
jgi:hypothetical protein